LLVFLFWFSTYCCEKSLNTTFFAIHYVMGILPLDFSVTAFLPFMFMGCIFLIHGGQEWGLVGIGAVRCIFLLFLFHTICHRFTFQNKYSQTHTFTVVIYPEHGRLNWDWSVGGSGMVSSWGVHAFWFPWYLALSSCSFLPDGM